MTQRRLFFLAAILLCGACSGTDDETGSAQAALRRGGRDSNSPIEGRRYRHYVVDGRVTDVADDLSGWQIRAWSGGRAAEAKVLRPGAFELSPVPPGEYQLELRGPTLAVPRYVVTRSRELDLGEFFLGRASAVAASSGTTLRLALSGLKPFAAGDDFQLTCAGAGLGYGSFLGYAAAAPQVGATTWATDVAYADLTAGGGGGLIDSSQKDVAYLTQLAAKEVSGDTFYAATLERAAQVNSLMMTNGATTPVVANLQDVTVRQRLRTQLRRDEFAALAPAINPHAQPIEYDLGVDVAPGGLSHGSISGTPDLAYMGVGPGPQSYPIDLSYGNPFPAEWGAFGFMVATYQVDLTVPHGSQTRPYTTFVRSVVNAPLEPFAKNGIRPFIGPVGSPRLDGQDLMTEQRASSSTPRVSWSAPALGRATFYTVTVTRLTVGEDGAVHGQKIGSVVTEATNVQLPAGLLTVGGSYTLTITATASESLEPSEQPFIRRYPNSFTDVVSAVVSLE